MDSSRHRNSPLPPHWNVERARDAYLAENGFTVAEYDAPFTPATFPPGITVKVPNTPRHRWALRLHDLHHVTTGYGTDPVGEAEISAWELRRGPRPLGLYVGCIVLLGALLGLLIAPRRTVRAFLAAGSGGSLFHSPRSYEALLALDVRALRRELGVDVAGATRASRRLHAGAPAAGEG